MMDLPQAITFDLESPHRAMSPMPHQLLHQHVFDIVPLVYNDAVDTSAITNVLFIDNTVQEYQQFVDGCNATTFPIVYDYHSDRNELKEVLTRKFSNIQRIAFVFHNAGMNGKLFLNNQCFFNAADLETPDNFSENFQVLVDIIRDFGVGHVDYLACNSLQYDNWKQYYEILKTTANVVVGASNDATGNLQYGGDWVMESTNEDIKTTYFNENIEQYTKTLATSTISTSITVTNASLNDSNVYTWPITITGGTASSPVVITFGDNITLNSNSKYFIIGSDYVTVDGSNQTVTVSGVTNYLGLIRNGTSSVNGYSNITVQKINITATGSTLGSYAGWICQTYFCRGSSGTNTITNCTNSGAVSGSSAGGIAGSSFAYNSNASSTNTISNCTNSGAVSNSSAGGIVGSSFAYDSSGTNTITNCTNSGAVSNVYAGGIAGSSFANSSSGTNTISNCTNSGAVSNISAGGIAGGFFANSSKAGSTNTISNCTNSGAVSGNNAGGIAGGFFADSSSGTNKISNCYTLSGVISSGILATYLSNTYAVATINAWSTTFALLVLLRQVNNTYIWAYPKDASGNNQTNSPFLLYSLNPDNTPVVPITTTISNFTILPKTFGTDVSFTLIDPSSNRSGNFAYTSSNPAIATTSGSTVTIVGAGSTTITASQAETANYTAGSADASLNVSKATTIISNFTIPSKIFGTDVSFILNPTTNSDASFSYTSSNTAVATISGSTVTIVGAGSTTITASQAETANYTAGSADASLNVSKATTIISNFTIPSKIFGTDVSFILNPTTNSDASFSYTSSNTAVATISGSTVTIVGAGSTTITASQAETANYTAGSADASLNVSKATTTISNFIIPSKTFGTDVSFILNPSSNRSGNFSYTSSNTSVATIYGSTVTIVGAGSTTITASQAETANYTAGSADASLNVSKATTILSNFIIPTTISEHTTIQLVPPQSNNPSGAFTYTSSDTSVAIIINNNQLKIVGNGPTNITATQAENNNYLAASITTPFNTSVIKFPQATDIQPNQITGTSEPNSTVVITETTINNQTLTNQVQSNSQGIWNFNVSVPSNIFSFAPLNANQFSRTITSNYNMKYPQKKYTLTTNTPVLIKPRQNGINPQDQRSWRISPKLPEGLKFSPISGKISGTPTVASASTTYNIWSISEIFLGYKKQLTIEIVSSPP